MPQKKQEPRTGLDTFFSVLSGGAIAALICLLTLALCAALMARGTLGEAWLNRAGPLGAFAGTLAGGGWAVRGTGRRALLSGMGAAGVFVLLCLLLGTVTGGVDWAGSGASILGTAAFGGALAGLLFAPGKKRRK